MKKGIFPYLPEGIQTASSSANWNGNSGIVKITTAGITVTFNEANYNDPLNDKPSIESGTMIFCQNSSSNTATLTITGGQLEDVSAASTSVVSGASATVLYLEEHGFVFLGQIG